MRILRNNRFLLSLLGFLPDEPIFPYKFVHTIVSSLVFLALILCQVSNTVFLVGHLKIGDYQNSMYAGIQTAGAITVIPILISLTYYHEKVRYVIGGFQRIFDKCNVHFCERFVA